MLRSVGPAPAGALRAWPAAAPPPAPPPPPPGACGPAQLSSAAPPPCRTPTAAPWPPLGRRWARAPRSQSLAAPPGAPPTCGGGGGRQRLRPALAGRRPARSSHPSSGLPSSGAGRGGLPAGAARLASASASLQGQPRPWHHPPVGCRQEGLRPGLLRRRAGLLLQLLLLLLGGAGRGPVARWAPRSAAAAVLLLLLLLGRGLPVRLARWRVVCGRAQQALQAALILRGCGGLGGAQLQQGGGGGGAGAGTEPRQQPRPAWQPGMTELCSSGSSGSLSHPSGRRPPPAGAAGRRWCWARRRRRPCAACRRPASTRRPRSPPKPRPRPPRPPRRRPRQTGRRCCWPGRSRRRRPATGAAAGAGAWAQSAALARDFPRAPECQGAAAEGNRKGCASVYAGGFAAGGRSHQVPPWITYLGRCPAAHPQGHGVRVLPRSVRQQHLPGG
jgi:hypothetical protein